MTATEIQSRWGIAGALHFEEAPGGLIRAVIASPDADGTIYLHGAHVAAWTPRGEQPVLYLSSKSRFEPGTPIRGGVPLVFPWFGPRTGGLPGPMHGYARITDWEIEASQLRPDGAVKLTLLLTPKDEAVELRFRVAMGSTLEMELEVHNLSDQPFHFEEALHTYFSIANIHSVFITGLEGTTCIDKTDAAARKQSEGPIRFTKETDQVHLNTPSTCEIHDPDAHRTIVVEKTGSQTTVVWNPWIEKNRNLTDMAPEDWQTMCCVETANALENAIQLPPRGIHQMAATIRITRSAT